MFPSCIFIHGPPASTLWAAREKRKLNMSLWAITSGDLAPTPFGGLRCFLDTTMEFYVVLKLTHVSISWNPVIAVATWQLELAVTALILDTQLGPGLPFPDFLEDSEDSLLADCNSIRKICWINLHGFHMQTHDVCFLCVSVGGELHVLGNHGKAIIILHLSTL